MLLTAILGCLAIVVLWWKINQRNKPNLDHIPGPKQEFWQRLFKTKKGPDSSNIHVAFTELQKRYGPVFKIQDAVQSLVVVGDYASIYQALVQKGKEFGGRQSSYRHDVAFGNTGILQSYHADEKWKVLRRVSHKHIKQFGDGLSRIESIVCQVGDDMFTDFTQSNEEPFDPDKSVFEASLNSISYLITGERTYSGHFLTTLMREYEDLALRTSTALTPKYFQLLDKYPFLKHLGFDNWKPFKRLMAIQPEIWDAIKKMNKSNPESRSIYKVFEEHMSESNGLMSEYDAMLSSLMLLVAGVATTSNTFLATINILAHRPDVQQKIYAEVEKVIESTGHPATLNDRAEMPYSRAALFEILRYSSIIPQGVRHRVAETAELQGYVIPKDTNMVTNLWALHHEESVWGDPFEFRPERYLDEEGEMIPADHPYRTHLMPFGAGTRVCLGESLALARLFLWNVSLVTKYHIFPAPGNEKSSTDPRKYRYVGVLKPNPFKVIFKQRQ